MTAIIDLGAGETDFLIAVLESIGEKYKISTDEGEIIGSDRIILAATDDTSAALREMHLLNLFTIIRICRKPLLGICSGMHLLADHSADSSSSYLGIFPVVTENFGTMGISPPDKLCEISFPKGSRLFAGIRNNTGFYFNNSSYIPVNEFTTSVAENKIKFSASVEKDNFYGIQFRAEKSGDPGVKVIQNFIEIE